MDALVMKLLIMVIAALITTITLLVFEYRTKQGTKLSYSLKGLVGIVLVGVLISLLTVR
ncbi:hypothetical protein [Lacticaseibacillus porcinae]|uniref:hypothetical protein n=1 Tax=Lacticaseibacillus porcinae TaxID=1123687 RepID=UPI0013DDD3AB|nr:hypothetical protein [Lacticaseibacillus porcinae]